ncbi:MAG: YiiD C-terminal domain-containing protein [Gammaproteobacteria bacterium]
MAGAPDDASAAVELEQYLRTRIPLTGAMQVRVREACRARVVLAAPLAPNINHQRTAFGGSVAALATLAAWSLLRVRLRGDGRAANVVIRRSTIDYAAAVTGELMAICEFSDEDRWSEAIARLRARGRARLEVESRLEEPAGTAARFHGVFVLLDAGADH